MKRCFDFLFAMTLTVLLFSPMLILFMAIKLSSKGPGIYWSERVGRHNIVFLMPKFRTMKINTPQAATHLLLNPEDYYTPLGSFLRKYSLDEVPQLVSIVQGKMSFVGPRPALFNQEDLIRLRVSHKIDQLVPGITGWAQVNGRDELSIEEKVNFELDYRKKQSFKFDLYIIWLTLAKVVKKDGISH